MQDTDFRLLMRHIPDEYTTLSSILSKEIAQILVFRAQDVVPFLAGSGIGITDITLPYQDMPCREKVSLGGSPLEERITITRGECLP
jgi:hypothetical protein